MGLWDPKSGEILKVLENYAPGVHARAFSPDGKLLAFGGNDMIVNLWDNESTEVLQMLEGHRYWIEVLAFSPDGKLLASATRGYTVKLWDTESRELLQTLNGHSRWVNAMAFSRDGKLLALALADNVVDLWDIASGEALETFDAGFPLRTFSLSADGSFFETDRGPLYVPLLSDSKPVSHPKLPASIYIDAQWVYRGLENILWLPAAMQVYIICEPHN
jgi:WD40 repeat protein